MLRDQNGNLITPGSNAVAVVSNVPGIVTPSKRGGDDMPETFNEKVAIIGKDELNLYTLRALDLLNPTEVKAVATYLGKGNKGVNKSIQFNIVNNHTSAVKFRVGSMAGLEGNYSKFGLDASAADNANVSDQNGAKVQYAQGTSLLSCHKPLLVSQFRIVSTDPQQLNTEVRYFTINQDNTVTPNSINTLISDSMDDFRNNLKIKNGNFILDSQSFLEFTIMPKVGDTPNSLQILIQVNAYHNIAFLTA